MDPTLARARFGILGDPPEFDMALEGQQDYRPSWDRYERVFREIFSRQYYTNQGPLTSELEERLGAFLGIKHVVCVTNTTIALIMAAEAMGLRGLVVVPALVSTSVLQSLAWVGLDPLFCDVDTTTHQIDIDQAAALLKKNTGNIAAILAVNPWGGMCNAAALRVQASHFGVRLYFDSVHAFGNCSIVASSSDMGEVEVFSLQAGRVLGGGEGGFLCTKDDLLAARLRNIRSSYGAGSPIAVVKTSNGRMSEAQAALGLLHLDDFPLLQARNRELFCAYKDGLGKVPGLRLLKPDGADNNHAYLICEIDEHIFGMSRDRLVAVLKAENISARHHECFKTALTCHEDEADAFPNAAKISRTCFQLPLGEGVSKEAVERVCMRIAVVRASAARILSKLET